LQPLPGIENAAAKRTLIGTNKPALLEELERLTSRERLELAYGLLDSVLHDATAPPLSDAQRDELRARVAHHRAHPDEPAVTLDDIRRKLTGR
jgi:putative addiction module component (TIGR02574 family)